MIFLKGMQTAGVSNQSIIVYKSGFGDDTLPFGSFWQVDELLDRAGWLTVGIHEELAVYGVGAILDCSDISINTVNQNCLD